jgi:septum formation protein
MFLVPVDESSEELTGVPPKSPVEMLPRPALALACGFSTRLFQVPLILASTSSIRRHMLEAAGVAHEARKPQVDEEELKLGLSEPREIAARLAIAKAVSVTGEWVIGSDSVVSAGGRIFNKPRDREEAAEHLRFFSGSEMRLTSAVALARGEVLDWSHVDTANLCVRPLSDAFIRGYLDAEWPEVGYTVGVFRLEGPGVQLFESIDGDYFTILGMPLVPLLGALRGRGLLAV